MRPSLTIGGTVCRVTGDGIMAVFGAPVASERHAVEACDAALAMQDAIGDYSTALEERGGRGVEIRVGLHSGEIVVLAGGDGDNIEYDADGPAVAIAARMEQAAKPGTVYLTSATRSLAESRVESEPLAPVLVKGISAPVPVHVLRRMRSVDESAPDAARTPFVGRRAELNQFAAILSSCMKEGYGQTVYVRGEPGIGKTRLIGELRGLAESRGVRCHRGLVLPFGVARGQDAIRALTRSLLAIAPDANRDERNRVASAAIEENMIEADQLVFLNELLDLTQPMELKSLYDAMDRTARNRGQQAVVAQLVGRLSSRHPVLIVIEDIHWADPMTVAHLAALARAVVEQPTLLVMTSRIEGDPLDQTWRTGVGGSGFTSMELGRCDAPNRWHSSRDGC